MEPYMSLYDRQTQKQTAAMAPYLEEGENVKVTFLGQTPVPPWVFFLIASYVFIFAQKYRLVVATDRNVYVMSNKFLSSYKFNAVAYKVPLASAQIESSSTWVSIDGGTKLRVPPFGPIKRGLAEFKACVQAARTAPPAQGTSVPPRTVPAG
jgi:hypothetical protein